MDAYQAVEERMRAMLAEDFISIDLYDAEND